MPVRPLKSFLPTAAELLALDVGALGSILLRHLNSYEGEAGNSVYQHGLLSQGNFFGLQEGRGLGPLRQAHEYGDQQPEVNRALKEAWNSLERQGLLIRDPSQPAPWFSISREGEKLLLRLARYEKWEKLGPDRVKADLTSTGGLREVGGGPGVADMAWEWLREKQNKPPLTRAASGEWVLIDESRLAELRALKSSQFDFRKLIRLCEELNIASREDCHFATGMLTRGLLDHVPPVFGVKSFSEVANHYVGGGKSFKETMLHLDTGAKKIADGLLHTQIRKTETLPTHQQVNFAAALDLLLGEIVRITQ